MVVEFFPGEMRSPGQRQKHIHTHTNTRTHRFTLTSRGNLESPVPVMCIFFKKWKKTGKKQNRKDPTLTLNCDSSLYDDIKNFTILLVFKIYETRTTIMVTFIFFVSQLAFFHKFASIQTLKKICLVDKNNVERTNVALKLKYLAC